MASGVGGGDNCGLDILAFLLREGFISSFTIIVDVSLILSSLLVFLTTAEASTEISTEAASAVTLGSSF
jgi:hypothetical protein